MSIDETTKETKSSSKGRILVVDDEPMLRNIFVEICSMAGYDADTAVNGREGLQRYLESREGIRPAYSLVLSDNTMPKMNGWEMMGEIAMNGNGVPVVLMSGDNICIDKARAQGFIHYEPKPVSIARMEEVIGLYAKNAQ